MIRRLLPLLLAAVGPAPAQETAPADAARTISEAKTAYADIDVLSLFNRLGLDRNQAIALLPICRDLQSDLSRIDNDLAAAERAQAESLAALRAGLLAGRQVSPQGVALLDKLDSAQTDHDVAREDALLAAYAQALGVLNDSQRDMLSDPKAEDPTDTQAAFQRAVNQQRDFAARREAVNRAYQDLALRARQTVPRERFEQTAPREVLMRIVAVTGLPPMAPQARQLQEFVLDRLRTIYAMTPAEYQGRGLALVRDIADATMYVIAGLTVDEAQNAVRIPSARFEAALSYGRTVQLLQHLARERAEAVQPGTPATPAE